MINERKNTYKERDGEIKLAGPKEEEKENEKLISKTLWKIHQSYWKKVYQLSVNLQSTKNLIFFFKEIKKFH